VKKAGRKGIRGFRSLGTIRRKGVHPGRNGPCPCGAVQENGKPMKFKNCCKPKVKSELD